MLSVAGGHRKRQVPAAGYFWPNIHPRLQGDAVGCFISPLCARFNRFFVYKVIFCSLLIGLLQAFQSCFHCIHRTGAGYPRDARRCTTLVG
ncbi:hypothetical protein IPC177_26995 [Pseudomonas aeruginosa]|nr:hypothetical protein DY997_04080 [Pseudomonas aeruginosa]TEL34638.1 hypothetical protein IPC177_26995 [Pseudomonas aeruginosa]